LVEAVIIGLTQFQYVISEWFHADIAGYVLMIEITDCSFGF
jgi:hypothetical protein